MKIVIISNFVYPYQNDPTGKMAHILANNLVLNGHDVTVFSKCASIRNVQKDNFNGAKYYGIKDLNSIYGQSLASILKKHNFFYSLILSILYFFSFIKRKIFRNHFNDNSKFIKYIHKITGDEKYDLAILFAGNFGLIDIFLKNKIIAGKKILYATDDWSTITNDQETFEKNISNTFDLIYSFYGVYKNLKFNNSKFKLCFPLVEIDHRTRLFTSKKNRPIISYFGVIHKERYSKELVNFLLKMAEKNDFVFYTINKNLIKQIRNPNIKATNYLDGDKYISAVSYTDFLLVIDNKDRLERFIPSKIFEYMATQKPILFLYYNETSPGLLTMKKYDNVYYVNLNREYDIKSINDFIFRNFRKISKIELYDIYPYCSAKNFIDKMKDDLEWTRDDELE